MGGSEGRACARRVGSPKVMSLLGACPAVLDHGSPGSSCSVAAAAQPWHRCCARAGAWPSAGRGFLIHSQKCWQFGWVNFNNGVGVKPKSETGSPAYLKNRKV